MKIFKLTFYSLAMTTILIVNSYASSLYVVNESSNFKTAEINRDEIDFRSTSEHKTGYNTEGHELLDSIEDNEYEDLNTLLEEWHDSDRFSTPAPQSSEGLENSLPEAESEYCQRVYGYYVDEFLGMSQPELSYPLGNPQFKRLRLLNLFMILSSRPSDNTKELMKETLDNWSVGDPIAYTFLTKVLPGRQISGADKYGLVAHNLRTNTEITVLFSWASFTESPETTRERYKEGTQQKILGLPSDLEIHEASNEIKLPNGPRLLLANMANPGTYALIPQLIDGEYSFLLIPHSSDSEGSLIPIGAAIIGEDGAVCFFNLQ